jgi:hypothetical protein
MILSVSITISVVGHPAKHLYKIRTKPDRYPWFLGGEIGHELVVGGLEDWGAFQVRNVLWVASHGLPKGRETLTMSYT